MLPPSSDGTFFIMLAEGKVDARIAQLSWIKVKSDKRRIQSAFRENINFSIETVFLKRC